MSSIPVGTSPVESGRRLGECALHHGPKPRAPRYFQPVSVSELVATGGSGRSPLDRTGP